MQNKILDMILTICSIEVTYLFLAIMWDDEIASVPKYLALLATVVFYIIYLLPGKTFFRRNKTSPETDIGNLEHYQRFAFLQCVAITLMLIFSKFINEFVGYPLRIYIELLVAAVTVPIYYAVFKHLDIKPKNSTS